MCLGSPFFLLLLITGLSFLSMPLRWLQHQIQLPELGQKASRFYQSPILAARLRQSELKELSGLAASFQHPQLLWGVVDSGGSSVLYGVHTTGALLAKVKVLGAVNRDWEDISAFQQHGVSYLLIADTGDNLLQRQSLRLYIVREPEVQAKTVAIERVIELSFTHAAHDIEAVAVDADGRWLYLLSKRSMPVLLYRLDLHLKQQQYHLDKPYMTLPSLKMRPTAMAISADGSRLAVLAYTDLYLWTRKQTESWKQVLQQAAEPLLLPKMRQAESITFSKADRGLFVSTERGLIQQLLGRGSPLYFYAEQAKKHQ